MIKLPDYLNEFAIMKKNDDKSLHFSLMCPCGKTDFSILVNKDDPELPRKEQLTNDLIKKYGGDHRCNIYSDDNYDLFINYKGIRSLFTKPTLIDKNILPIETKIVKAKCMHCGKEFVIYDNRIHGITFAKKDERNYSYSNFNFKEISTDNIIEIILEYDLTIDSYNKNYLSSNKKPYENCFSYIKVFYKNKNNQETIIFEDEI